MKIKKNKVTAAIFCKNEEYWIHYVLKNLLEVIGSVIMLDTGSDDMTIPYAKQTHAEIGGSLHIIEENYGTNANKIGNSPNILREMIKTDWMLLVGGDEIWPGNSLNELINSNMPHAATVGMVCGRNILEYEGHFVEGNRMSADRIFSKDVKWGRIDYPYESHGLDKRLKRNEVHYLNGNAAFYWHVRNLQRSSKSAFFRHEKANFFREKLGMAVPNNWITLNSNYKNPYFNMENR